MDKCWCGGKYVETYRHIDLPDMQESVKISFSECTTCYSEFFTEEQKEINLSIIESARKEEDLRDFEAEAREYMKARKARGQLIPDGYQDDPLKFQQDFDQGKNAIFARVTEGALRLFCEDLYDSIGVTLDHKQEEELFELLSARRNVAK